MLRGSIIKRRKLNRLEGYNYSSDGHYFVTICTKNKINYFGKIENEEMILSRIGKVANYCWQKITEHFPNVELDEYIVIPNHVHGIIVIRESNDLCVGNKNFCSLQKDKTIINWQSKWSKSLSSIIKGIK